MAHLLLLNYIRAIYLDFLKREKMFFFFLWNKKGHRRRRRRFRNERARP